MAALQYLTLLRNTYGHTNMQLYTVIISQYVAIFYQCVG